MDLFGIGALELLVILTVAIIVLGPHGTINIARSAGKMMGEVRRAFGELSKAVDMDDLKRDWTTKPEDLLGTDRETPPEEKR